MGTIAGTTRVDPAALRAAAGRLDAAADIMLAALGAHTRELRFTGAVAGRAHTVSGGEVRAALDGLLADAATWAQRVRDLAGTLRDCAQRHSCHEAQAAAGLR